MVETLDHNIFRLPTTGGSNVFVMNFLVVKSPSRSGVEKHEIKSEPRLSYYAHLGPESLKRDLEECQALVPDLANVKTGTLPYFQLSQLVS